MQMKLKSFNSIDRPEKRGFDMTLHIEDFSRIGNSKFTTRIENSKFIARLENSKIIAKQKTTKLYLKTQRYCGNDHEQYNFWVINGLKIILI